MKLYVHIHIMKYSYHCTQLRRYLASSCRFIITLLITPHYKNRLLESTDEPGKKLISTVSSCEAKLFL